MLKAMLPLSTVAGLFFAVPMAVDETPRSLQSALDETVRALDVLRGFETAGPRAVDSGTIRAATEDPASDPVERLARLDRLHTELQRLQLHLELLQSGVSPAYAPLPTSSLDVPVPVPTVGLADGELARILEHSRRPPPIDLEPAATSTRRSPLPSNFVDPRVASPAPTTFETIDADSSAAGGSNTPAAVPLDPALAFSRARAAYFAGQYERSLADFEAGPDDARHRYWRARCLEQLGRLTEALTFYDLVVSDIDAGELIERARSDADFLRWKIQFETGTTTK